MFAVSECSALTGCVESPPGNSRAISNEVIYTEIMLQILETAYILVYIL